MKIVREKFIETIPSADGLTFEERESFIYRIVEMSPNADGLYEFAKTQHFTLPPLDAENTLKEAGFRYAGLKKGDAFTELWALDQPSQPKTVWNVESLDSGKPITPLEMTNGTHVSPTRLMDISPPEMEATKQSCQWCGMQVKAAGFIFGNPDNAKIVNLHVCSNPVCSFYYVEVRREADLTARAGVGSETPPDTTPAPTPHLAGKSAPVDDGRRKAGEGLDPSFRLPDPKPDPEAGQYTRKGG